MNPQATAGRIVHYTDATGQSAAAIVNRDASVDGVVQLTTFYEKGPVSMPRVQYSEEPQPGYWSWMPFQKAKAETAAGNQSESAEPRPTETQLPEWLERQLEGLTKGLNDRFEDLERRVTELQGDAAAIGLVSKAEAGHIKPLGEWTNSVTDRLDDVERRAANLEDVLAMKGPSQDVEKTDGGPEKTTEPGNAGMGAPPSMARVDDTPDTVESGPHVPKGQGDDQSV